ncbi:MAG: hypothetical protein ACR2PH_00240, partial [Desulfobulbia bacterium]
GYDRPVLLKEPAHDAPGPSRLDQLHNEYAITRRLTGVAGVRPVLGKEGTMSRPVLLLEYIQGHPLLRSHLKIGTAESLNLGGSGLR